MSCNRVWGILISSIRGCRLSRI